MSCVMFTPCRIHVRSITLKVLILIRFNFVVLTFVCHLLYIYMKLKVSKIIALSLNYK